MRDSLIVYRSFYEAISNMPKTVQAEVWAAVFEYGLNFKEIELNDRAKTIFTLIKPQLDANIRKYKNGKMPKQNRSETEANDKQSASKTEANVNGNLNENDNENNNDDDNDNTASGDEIKQLQLVSKVIRQLESLSLEEIKERNYSSPAFFLDDFISIQDIATSMGIVDDDITLCVLSWEDEWADEVFDIKNAASDFRMYYLDLRKWFKKWAAQHEEE